MNEMVLQHEMTSQQSRPISASHVNLLLRPRRRGIPKMTLLMTSWM